MKETEHSIVTTAFHRRAFGWALGALCGATLCIAGGAYAKGPVPNHKLQKPIAYADVIGPGECSECHESENNVWQQTGHHLGGKLLSRDPKAREIAAALGIRRLKNDSRCTTCHYTVSFNGEKEKNIAGVSCESCHGEARQWVDLHSDFGGPGVTVESETEAHRAERWKSCDEAGFVRPGRIYDMALQCQRCHTIDNEEIVVSGGHVAQPAFEFVSWSQGSVRHNFVREGTAVNAESTVERLRVMLVLGRLAGLESALRGLSHATGENSYSAAMLGNIEASLVHLRAIEAGAATEEIAGVLAMKFEGLESLGVEKLLNTAEMIRKAARSFEAAHDGADLKGLDSLLPKSYRQEQ